MLIPTKLNIPPIRTALLDRPRLIRIIRDGIDGRLTLISAPAGFGKTCLVCQWIEQERARAAWYSLDENDNDPSLFFRYLLTTLASRATSLKAPFKPLLHGQGMPEGRDVMGRIIHHLEGVSTRMVLVLDDYHEIQSEAVHDAVGFLIQNMPRGMHVIIASRHARNK